MIKNKSKRDPFFTRYSHEQIAMIRYYYKGSSVVDYRKSTYSVKHRTASLIVLVGYLNNFSDFYR